MPEGIRMDADGWKPLSGFRVIDLSTFVAAPAAAKMLADWGAEVIKVESLSGDPWRMNGLSYGVPIDPLENPIFDLDNLAKKFIAVNLKTEAGKDIMHRLLEGADVLLTNLRPEALKRQQLSYEELSVKYPRLVFGQILGFGEKGPEADSPGFDLVAYWARSGAMLDLVPAEANVPINGPSGFGDHPTGAALAAGVCAALLQRARTGRGDKVTVSLYANAIFNVGSMIVSAQAKYGFQFPRPRSNPMSPTIYAYQCKDGRWLMLSILEYERLFPVFCKRVLGMPELAEDERFRSKVVMQSNSGILVGILAKIFATRTFDEWSKLLVEADIAFDRVAKFRDVTTDEQALANSFVYEHTFENGNSAFMPRTPVRFESLPVWNAPAGTRIGEHTKEVLLHLGYREDEIAGMENVKAVRCAS